MGSIVRGSGFEDIVFQSGLCTSGSLQGVLAGSHYNRGWTVHNAMSEALERLLMSRFLNEKNPVVPESLVNLSADPNPSTVQQVHEDLLEFF